MGLFSTTHNHHRTEVAPAYPQTVNVHKAPTDKSIALLREMEEKARRQVVNQVHVKNNVFDGTVMVHKRELDRSFIVSYRFKINGEEILIEDVVDKFGLCTEKHELIGGLYKYVSEELCRTMVEMASVEMGLPLN